VPRRTPHEKHHTPHKKHHTPHKKHHTPQASTTMLLLQAVNKSEIDVTLCYYSAPNQE